MKTKQQVIAKYERKYKIGKSMITITKNGDIYTICTYVSCTMDGCKVESSIYSDYDSMESAEEAFQDMVARHMTKGCYGHTEKNGYNVYLTK